MRARCNAVIVDGEGRLVVVVVVVAEVEVVVEAVEVSLLFTSCCIGAAYNGRHQPELNYTLLMSVGRRWLLGRRRRLPGLAETDFM